MPVNSDLIPQIGRFLLLVAIQVLVLKQVGENLGKYFVVFIYPIFILLLPRGMHNVKVLLYAFLIGITVDLFYITYGMHAAASVFSAYCRGFLLKAFEPRSGYSDATIASKFHFGWQWFLGYSALFMLFHTFFYFSVESFTFVYLLTITLRTIAAWALSMLFVMFYTLIFNPKS
jgi:hypothetical protein